MSEAHRSSGHDTAELLSGFAIFARLEAGSLRALAATGHRQSWAAGTLIFQRGDLGDYMLAVLSGRIRLSLGTASGKELVLRHIKAGDVLGELALLDGEPRSADAVAAAPTTAIVIRRDRFQQVALSDPALGLSLARYLCSLLRNTNFQMESIALYDLQMRVVRFLLFVLGQTYGTAIPPEAELRLTFNQAELSSLLGASRPKINQVLQTLIASGAIRRDGDRINCLVDRLQKLVQSADMSNSA
ncbi:cyclic nucleotide-binding domain-containing protein [bacterium]|nr:cyclic nucleotide-binding domain-containing protein [bacterium]